MKKNHSFKLTIVLMIVGIILLSGCPNGLPDAGNGNGTDEGDSSIDSTPPGDVTGFTATPGDGVVTLTWNEPGDSDYAKVEITYSPGGTDPVDVYNGTTTRTITGLTNGTEYSFTVKSVDTSGNRSGGVTDTATPVAADPLEIQENLATTVVMTEEYSEYVDISYSGSGTLELSLTEAPAGMAFNEVYTRTLEWIPRKPQTANVTISVTDGTYSDEYSFQITVTEHPDTPYVSTEPVVSAQVGIEYTYDVDAVDPNGDSISYSVWWAPTGMSIDSSTGVITWIPGMTDGTETFTLPENDSFSVSVRISDGTNTNYQKLNIEVSDPIDRTSYVAPSIAYETTELISGSGVYRSQFDFGTYPSIENLQRGMRYRHAPKDANGLLDGLVVDYDCTDTSSGEERIFITVTNWINGVEEGDFIRWSLRPAEGNKITWCNSSPQSNNLDHGTAIDCNWEYDSGSATYYYKWYEDLHIDGNRLGTMRTWAGPNGNPLGLYHPEDSTPPWDAEEYKNDKWYNFYGWDSNQYTVRTYSGSDGMIDETEVRTY